MKKTAKRSCRILMVLLLAVSMVFGALPALTGQAYADDTEIVTVGSGTAMTTDAPYRTNFGNSRTQVIYHAEDIDMDGSIVSVAYNVASVYSDFGVTKMRIWMGTTDIDYFNWNVSPYTVAGSPETFGEGKVTLVYEGTPEQKIGASTGWETIELDTPFDYKREAGNLVIVTGVETSGKGSVDLKYYAEEYPAANHDHIVTLTVGCDDPTIASLSYNGDENWRFPNCRPNIQLGFDDSSAGGETGEKFTVSFDADGGSPVPADQTVTDGRKAKKPADPSKEGFDFVGWYNGDTEYDFNNAVTADLTLKARWKEQPPAPTTALEVGDLVDAGNAAAEGYTGVPLWRVIDKKDDQVLLLSEHTWKGNGKNAGSLISFGSGLSKEEGIDWNNTDAAAWCDAFEEKVLKDVEGLSIIPFSHTDPEYTYTTTLYGSNNRSYNFKKIYAYDTVFFLSAEEVATCMGNPADRTAGMPGSDENQQWLLRSTAVVGGNNMASVVKNDGELTTINARDGKAARPAFWAKVDESVFEASEDGGAKVWRAKGTSDKAALKTAVDSAETDLTGTPVSEDGVGLEKGKLYTTSENKETFEKAVSNAKTVLGDAAATQQAVDDAVQALNSAKDAFDAAKKESEGKTDKTALESAVNAANDDLNNTTASENGEGLEVGTVYATAASREKFADAINTAQAVLDDETATQIKINNAVTALNNAKKTFDNSKKTVKEPADKSALESAKKDAQDALDAVKISEDGEELPKGTKYVTQEDADSLQLAIDLAQAVFENADAEQDDVDEAVTSLRSATAKFESAVKTAEGQEIVDNPYITVTERNDAGKSFEVKELPWSYEDYTKDGIPPVYVAEVDRNTTFLLIKEHGFAKKKPHELIVPWTCSTLTFEKDGAHYESSCTSGGGGECDLGLGDIEDTESTGIAAIADYWYGYFGKSVNADALQKKLSPYAHDPEKPEDTEAALLWVYGAAPANRIDQVEDYILVLIYEDPEGDAEKAAETVSKASDDADTAKAAADKSKAAAAKAAKTPGAAAVKAAKKAQTDAKAAKEAADAYKAAADAYAEAADKAYGPNDERTKAAKEAAAKADKDAKAAANALTAANKAVTAAQKAAADAKAKKVRTVTVNVPTVTAAAIDKAVKAKGGSNKYVTKIILGRKVKTIRAKAFSKYGKVTLLEVRTSKLTKKSVKNSLRNSKVKTVKVKVAKKAATNKKYITKYKKIFTRKNAGRSVKVTK